MTFPIEIRFETSELFNGQIGILQVFEGILTLVGPNGSGKTRFLHALKHELGRRFGERVVRYLSPGRLAGIEHFRSDVNGDRGGQPFRGHAIPTPVGSQHLLPFRRNSSGITGDLLALQQRPDLRIVVESRLRSLFGRRIGLEWSQDGLRVEFARVDQGDQYPASHEASGLLHLISILAAAYDDEVGVLLVDEPEVSLHPQLQSYVLRELRSVAGDPANRSQKLIVISTHSPAMLRVKRPEHLTRIVFFQDSVAPPRQISVTAPELNAKSISALLARMGEAHRNAFFAHNILLVEGPSDEIVAHAIAAKLDLPLDAAGTQIVPVIGKGEIGAAIKLFKMIGKNCAVLADLDALVDDGKLVGVFLESSVIKERVATMGHRDLRSFSDSIRADLGRQIELCFGDISVIAEQHYYFKKRSPDADVELARVRAGAAVLLEMGNEEINRLPGADKWMSLKTRVHSLIDVLELGGCFVLRKGTIESYALSAPAVSERLAKPEAAAVLGDEIQLAESFAVQETMGDIIRALRYVANRPPIDEDARLRQLLQSVLAPCFDECTKDTSETELDQRVREVLGDRASLFKIENVTSDDGLPRLRVSILSRLIARKSFPIEVTKKDFYEKIDAALPRGTSYVEGLRRSVGVGVSPVRSVLRSRETFVLNYRDLRPGACYSCSGSVMQPLARMRHRYRLRSWKPSDEDPRDSARA